MEVWSLFGGVIICSFVITAKYTSIALLKTRSKSALEGLSEELQLFGFCVFSKRLSTLRQVLFGTSLRFANKQMVTDAPKAPRIFLSSLSLLASIAKRRG